jgi:hypothetical protein
VPSVIDLFPNVIIKGRDTNQNDNVAIAILDLALSGDAIQPQ